MNTNRRESAVKAAIHAYLDTRTDLYFWRANTGGAKFDNFFVKFNESGVSDFLGLQAMFVENKFGGTVFVGRFVAIEAKREKGGTQSDDQKRFQANVEAHGGLYVIARSVDEVAKALGPATVHAVKQVKQRVIPR